MCPPLATKQQEGEKKHQSWSRRNFGTRGLVECVAGVLAARLLPFLWLWKPDFEKGINKVIYCKFQRYDRREVLSRPWSISPIQRQRCCPSAAPSRIHPSLSTHSIAAESAGLLHLVVRPGKVICPPLCFPVSGRPLVSKIF